MPDNLSVASMTAAASTLGWKPGEFPDTFTTQGTTGWPEGDHEWTKKEITTSPYGIHTVSYQDQHGEWLIVFSD